MANGRLNLAAVLFDVDFTIAKPGPLLGPEGYRDAGRRFGLELDPDRYAEARAAALIDLQHHPELDHDEEVWIRFTEDIVRGMGGEGAHCRAVAEAITEGWLHSENFELYEDVLPVFALLRERRIKIGLVSNTSRDLDAFVRHHRLDVDGAEAIGIRALLLDREGKLGREDALPSLLALPAALGLSEDGL